MVQIGVISNPRSQKNKGGIDKVDALLARHPHVFHHRLKHFDDLKGAVSDFTTRNVDVIAVNGGDGTVQATLTELFRVADRERPPILAVLSGGMTNMIAADAGLTGTTVGSLKRLIAMADNGHLSKHLVSRQVLRIDWGADTGPLCGMFFGAAGICRGINACRERVHTLGIKSSLAVGLTVVGMLLRTLLPRRGGEDLFQGDPISVTLDGCENLDRCYFLLIVTTLDHLILRSRPYWGEQRGALRLSGVLFPPKRFLRSVFSLFYGGQERNLPEDTYLSRSADKIRLDLKGPFTLDGEMYQPVPGHSVELSCAGLVRLVKF